MARIKIKHPTQTQDDKRALLAILANHNVYATKITGARDGFIILTSLENESDFVFNEECYNELTNKSFQPLMPPELKAQRTILMFSVDSDAKKHSADEITEHDYDIADYGLTEDQIQRAFADYRDRFGV